MRVKLTPQRNPEHLDALDEFELYIFSAALWYSFACRVFQKVMREWIPPLILIIGMQVLC